MITADEARTLVLESSGGLKNFDDWVRTEVENYNSTSGHFEGKLTEVEVNFIRKQGFHIFWDRVCLWWEVSWEIENE